MGCCGCFVTFSAVLFVGLAYVAKETLQDPHYSYRSSLAPNHPSSSIYVLGLECPLSDIACASPAKLLDDIFLEEKLLDSTAMATRMFDLPEQINLVSGGFWSRKGEMTMVMGMVIDVNSKEEAESIAREVNKLLLHDPHNSGASRLTSSRFLPTDRSSM
jgi:hypothetical protein